MWLASPETQARWAEHSATEFLRVALTTAKRSLAEARRKLDRDETVYSNASKRLADAAQIPGVTDADVRRLAVDVAEAKGRMQSAEAAFRGARDVVEGLVAQMEGVRSSAAARDTALALAEAARCEALSKRAADLAVSRSLGGMTAQEAMHVHGVRTEAVNRDGEVEALMRGLGRGGERAAAPVPASAPSGLLDAIQTLPTLGRAPVSLRSASRAPT